MAILLTVVKHFPKCPCSNYAPSSSLFRLSPPTLIYATIIFSSGETLFMQGQSTLFALSRVGGKKVAGKVERNFVLYMSTWNGQLQRSRATLRNRSEGTAKWVFNKISSFVIVLLRLGRPIRKHLHCATASRYTLDKGRNARIHCNGKFLGLTYACNALSRGCCDRSMNNRLTAVSWENVKLSTSSSILLL